MLHHACIVCYIFFSCILLSFYSVFNRLRPTWLNTLGRLRSLNPSPLSLALETTVSAIKHLLLAERHYNKTLFLMLWIHALNIVMFYVMCTSVGVSADCCLQIPRNRSHFNKTAAWLFVMLSSTGTTTFGPLLNVM